MGVVGRLDQYASMLATEFDDYSMSENLVTDSAIDFGYSFNNQILPTENDIAPNGLTVLCKHNLTSSSTPFLDCRADITLSSGNTYTMSMYLKGTTSFSASFAFVGETTNEIYANTANITTTWQRFTLTFTLVATQTASRLQLFFSAQGAGKVVSVWGAQLERGSVATDYTSRPSGTAISRILPATTNTNITGLGTYYASGFDENIGFTTFLSANVFPPYDLVYDDFGGTSFGAGQGRYMRQNTDKSVIVYNEIDEITDFRDIVRSGLVLDIDMQQPLSYTGRGLTLYDLSGNNNNATAVTTLGVANDAPGTVISLDTSSEIQVNLTANINKYAFTFSYWGRPTAIPDSNYQGICRLIDTSNPAHGYYFTMDTREVATPSVLHYVKDYTTSNWDTRQMISNAEYLNYKWHYYTLVMFAENDWKSYLDGQLLGTNTTPSQDLSSYGDINRVYFGGSSCNFNIANFSMYSTSLTSTQILQNFNALKHRFGL
jgi:hypothetical protein